MSAQESYDVMDDDHDETTGNALGTTPDLVEIRRNGGLAGVVGVVASAVAIAWLGRAFQSGAVLDWALFAVTGSLGVVWLHAFVDARTPLLVADAQGVRLRLGKVWRGLPWGALESIEHTPRAGLLRDGRIVLHPHNPERVVAELDASGRRQSAWSQRLHHAPLAVPLGLSTRVSALSEDLTTSLRVLAGDTTHVIEVEVAPERYEPTPEVGDLAEQEADAEVEPAAVEPTPDVVAASATPAPLRAAAPVSRIEIRSDLVLHNTALEGTAARKLDDDEQDRPGNGLPEGRELRRDGSVNLVEETVVWGDRVRPIATAGEPVEPLVIDDFAVEPAPEPVIGPEIAAARTRIGLGVDALAERTRIRPHVLESIEVDDFHACGGDFYARGHLRTLARVLGLDPAPLLKAYDEKYADAPINARRVFEAELATGAGGGLRATKGGPNWSLLIAVVMTLVLAWSIARLAMDSPVEIQNPAPILNGSDGPNQTAPISQNVTAKVSATTATHLTVTDGGGKVVFDDDVDYGEVHRLDVRPPVKVTAADAGAIEVEIDGDDRGAVGQDGKKASRTYRAED